MALSSHSVDHRRWGEVFVYYSKPYSSTPTTHPTHTHTPTPDSTHPPALEKMGDIVEDDICKCIFLNENYKIPIRIPLKFVPRSPTDNKAALVPVMTWRRTGDKPLPEPMLTRFTDA